MSARVEEMASACDAAANLAEYEARHYPDGSTFDRRKLAHAVKLRAAAKTLRRHKAVFAMIYDLAMGNEWPDKSDGERIAQIAGIASMQDDEVIAAMEGGDLAERGEG